MLVAWSGGKITPNLSTERSYIILCVLTVARVLAAMAVNIESTVLTHVISKTASVKKQVGGHNKRTIWARKNLSDNHGCSLLHV